MPVTLTKAHGMGERLQNIKDALEGIDRVNGPTLELNAWPIGSIAYGDDRPLVRVPNIPTEPFPQDFRPRRRYVGAHRPARANRVALAEIADRIAS